MNKHLVYLCINCALTHLLVYFTAFVLSNFQFLGVDSRVNLTRFSLQRQTT